MQNHDDESVQSPQEYWQQRYAGPSPVWSGDPNAAVVAVASELSPGSALDLGCGEGGDVIWLARHGWRAHGVDISANAIARAEAAARDAELDSGQATFEVADLSEWTTDQVFDLVSASFLHSRVELARRDVLRRAAAYVAPSGHLLICSHFSFPPWAQHRHQHDPHQMPTPAEEVAALELDMSAWTVVLAELRTRDARSPEGEIAPIDDSVVLLHRR